MNPCDSPFNAEKLAVIRKKLLEEREIYDLPKKKTSSKGSLVWSKTNKKNTKGFRV